MITFTVGLDRENLWRIVTRWGRQLIWLPFRYKTREEAEKELALVQGKGKDSICNLDNPNEFYREWLKFWEDVEGSEWKKFNGQ